MVTMIDRILCNAKHEEQAYNRCKDILHMCTDAPRHIVVEAAQTCLDMASCKYTYFKEGAHQADEFCHCRGRFFRSASGA